jgi:hypothetical protein
MTTCKACLQGAVTTGSFMLIKVVIATYIKIVSCDNQKLYGGRRGRLKRADGYDTMHTPDLDGR